MPEDKDFELDDLEPFPFDDVPLEGDTARGEASDEFGVWVKSAPEDVAEGDSGFSADSEMALPDLDELPPLDDFSHSDDPAVGSEFPSLDDLDALPGLDFMDTDIPSPGPSSTDLAEEDFLSSEELASLDDQFDLVSVSAEPLEGEEDPLADEFDILDSAPPVTSSGSEMEEMSLEDFVSLDDEDLEAAGVSEVPSMASSPQTADEFDDDFLDMELDMSDDIEDEELEVLETAQVVANTSPAVDPVTEDVELSEFGDFDAMSDLAGPTQPKGKGAHSDFDINLDADELTLDTDGEFEEKSLNDSLDPDDQNDLEKLQVLEDDLTSGIRAAEPMAPNLAQAGLGTDLAAAILSKIEQELSSIKREIADLKKDLSGYRSGAPALSPPGEPPLPEMEDIPPKHEHKGFFDDEDDETIALTGDELDTLLLSADISEAEDEGVTLDEDLLVTDEEGNLPPLADFATPSNDFEASPEEGHVTDEEFFAGTSLEEEEDSLFDEPAGGVPESIELEDDDFPEVLEADQMVDVLGEIPEPSIAEDADPVFEPLDLEVPPVASPEPVRSAAPPAPAPAPPSKLPESMRGELKAVLTYMDKLLVSLPDDKIQEFAETEHFEVYKKLFEELGLKE